MTKLPCRMRPATPVLQCTRCKRERPIRAKGMCHSCYTWTNYCLKRGKPIGPWKGWQVQDLGDIAGRIEDAREKKRAQMRGAVA